MTFDIKIRKWLWIVLIIVVVLGGSFTYWQVYGNKTSVTAKTSPTPKKSASISPSASTIGTPTSNKTGTPEPTSTATPEKPTWSGTLNSWWLGACAPGVTFEYPAGYDVYQTKYANGGTTATTVLKDNISIDLSSSTKSISGVTPCVYYDNPTEYYEKAHVIESDHIKDITITGPETFTVNGYAAIKWTQKYTNIDVYGEEHKYNEKVTVIQNSAGKIVVISTKNDNMEAFDMIVNTIRIS